MVHSPPHLPPLGKKMPIGNEMRVGESKGYSVCLKADLADLAYGCGLSFAVYVAIAEDG